MQHFLGQSLQLNKQTNPLMSPADLNSPQSFWVMFSEPMKGLSSVWSLSSCNKKFVLVFQMLN